jgi:hypothetical protein
MLSVRNQFPIELTMPLFKSRGYTGYKKLFQANITKMAKKKFCGKTLNRCRGGSYVSISKQKNPGDNDMQKQNFVQVGTYTPPSTFDSK